MAVELGVSAPVKRSAVSPRVLSIVTWVWIGLLIAGAADRVTAMACAHAASRVQFGKPVARQQAVQHMLAVMGEDLVAARIAARLGAAHGLAVVGVRPRVRHEPLGGGGRVLQRDDRASEPGRGDPPPGGGVLGLGRGRPSAAGQEQPEREDAEEPSPAHATVTRW